MLSIRAQGRESDYLLVNHRVYVQHRFNNYVAVSDAINRACQRVFSDLGSCFARSPEFPMWWHTLNGLPRNYGSVEKAIPAFQGVSALEQMIVLQSWFVHSPNRVQGHRYTFCFANSSERLRGRAIPLSIQTKAKDMMGVMLGSRHRDYRALKYSEMAVDDPWNNIRAENFIYALESLEMIRCPDLIGATLIKGNAYESECIDEDWRYGDGREACMEFVGQKRLSSGERAIRAQSAAYNLFKLMQVGLRDVDICFHTTHSYLAVCPDDILESFNRGGDALYYQMFRLMVAKMGTFSSPSMQAFANETLRRAWEVVPINPILLED